MAKRRSSDRLVEPPFSGGEDGETPVRPGRGGRRPGAGRPAGVRAASRAEAAVQARVRGEELQLIERAAKGEGVSLSRFLRVAAIARATRKNPVQIPSKNRAEFAAVIAALLPLQAGVFSVVDAITQGRIREVINRNDPLSKSLTDTLREIDATLEKLHALLAPISVPESGKDR
jgi:hypothetical protein